MLSPTLQWMTPLSDEDLVARILDGDAAVFELLMRRHNQRLFRIARAVLSNNDDAEEVVQESYLRAYTHLSRFEGRSSVATWLSRITFHEALRRKRQRKRTRIAGGLDLDELTQAAPDVATPLIQAEARSSLTSALDSLPTGLRAIVMLRIVEGLSTRETAESLRISESNVKVSLHRARHLLAEAIERQAIPRLREQFRFAEARCDRIVARVFARLAGDASLN